MKRKITFSQLYNNRGGKSLFKQPLNCVVCKCDSSFGGGSITSHNYLLDKSNRNLLDSNSNKLCLEV